MNRPLFYKLEGHKPVACYSYKELSLGKDVFRVALTKMYGMTISTVFLVIDHGFGEGPPVLFETMIFGGPLDQTTMRYCTWEEAEEGHNLCVQKVQNLGWWQRMCWHIKDWYSSLRKGE